MNKAIATMAAAAALTGLGACDRLGPGSGTASADKAAAAPANSHRAAAKAGQRSADSGQAAAAAQRQQGLAGNPNVIQTSSTGIGAPIDRGYFIGRWTDDSDCRRAGEFIYDGRFTTAGGEQGTWALEGDRLTMNFGAGPRTLRIEVVDQQHMKVVNPDGSVGHSTRC